MHFGPISKVGPHIVTVLTFDNLEHMNISCFYSFINNQNCCQLFLTAGGPAMKRAAYHLSSAVKSGEEP